MPEKMLSFKSPPIAEVAISVQHERSTEYYDLYANYAYEKLRDRYPAIEERDTVPPVFETFSGERKVYGGGSIKLGLTNQVINNRYFFVTEDESEIVQYQADRIGFNWRRREGEYPGFETVFGEFKRIAGVIGKLHEERKWGKLRPTQCEITYVNRIAVSDIRENLPINFFSGTSLESLESFRTGAISIVKHNGEAIGRMYVDTNIVSANEGPQIVLQLVFRGPPGNDDLEACFKRIEMGHETIIKTFERITTEDAKATWKLG